MISLSEAATPTETQRVDVLGKRSAACAAATIALPPLMMRIVTLVASLVAVVNDGSRTANASPVSAKDVPYTADAVEFVGYLAKPEGPIGKRPGILVVHDWTGLQTFTQNRAKALAELGYVAFCADIYGKGVRPSQPTDSAKEAGKYKGNRALFRARLKAALDELLKDPNVDPAEVAVIGYCFGGTAALELARSGAPVAGAVSFHGGLDSPTPADARKIKGKVLALHGADDPYVKPDEVIAFGEEMSEAGVDWQLIAYGGAVHAFTNPAAGNDPSKGAAYHESANRRSWQAMQMFFLEIFPSFR
jgi:dienelactone hydrolase